MKKGITRREREVTDLTRIREILDKARADMGIVFPGE